MAGRRPANTMIGAGEDPVPRAGGIFGNSQTRGDSPLGEFFSSLGGAKAPSNILGKGGSPIGDAFRSHPELFKQLASGFADDMARSRIDKLGMADTLLRNKASLAQNAELGTAGSDTGGLLSASELARKKINEEDRLARFRTNLSNVKGLDNETQKQILDLVGKL